MKCPNCDEEMRAAKILDPDWKRKLANNPGDDEISGKDMWYCENCGYEEER